MLKCASTRQMTAKFSPIRSIKMYTKELPLITPYCLSGGNVHCECLPATFVQIETEDGLCGWGESTSWSHNYIPAFAGGVRSALDLLAPLLLGQDATDIDRINDLMDEALSGHIYAKSCIDMACWDVLARRANLPLYALLGGRCGVGVPANSSISTGTAQQMNDDIQKHRELGYKVHSAKIGGHDPNVDIDRIRGVMDALPRDEDVTFDVNRAWTPAIAIEVMNATQEIAPGWFEQPCQTLDECVTVRTVVRQPILLDEGVDSFDSHLQALRRDACQGIKLKPLKSGGLTKARRIRDLAVNVGWRMHIEAVGGSVLADTAALHLALSTPPRNRMASWLSHMHLLEECDIAPGQGARLREDGLITLSDAPGIGVTPDSSMLGAPAAVYSRSSHVHVHSKPKTHEIPKFMKAMVLTGHGSLDRIKFQSDWPVPELREDECLIKVHACGLNNADINMCLSWYSQQHDGAANQASSNPNISAKWNGKEARLPTIQGHDVCGTVVAVSPNCEGRSLLNRRVMVDPWIPTGDAAARRIRSDMDYLGSEVDGGYAEFCAVPIANVYSVDDLPYSDAELASVPCSAVAAETMLHNAGVKDGDVVLVTGASGGVGISLLSLVKRRGATVIAVTSQSKIDQMLAFGADYAIPREKTEDVELLRETLKQECGLSSVTVVADTVGGKMAETGLQMLDQRGRYVSTGAISGAMVQLDLRSLIYRDLKLFGAAQSHASCFADIVSYLRRGEFIPRVAAQYPLERLHEAMTEFRKKKHVGNIVVHMKTIANA